jgi:hypothetical protein
MSATHLPCSLIRQAFLVVCIQVGIPVSLCIAASVRRHPFGLSWLLRMWAVGYDFIIRSEVKFTLEQAVNAQRVEWEYSSTPFLISALGVGGWPTPRPGRLTPEKETRYSLYRRLGGPQTRSGRMRKISPPAGIRSPDRPALSEPLYWLRYLAFTLLDVCSERKIKANSYRTIHIS